MVKIFALIRGHSDRVFGVVRGFQLNPDRRDALSYVISVNQRLNFCRTEKLNWI